MIIDETNTARSTARIENVLPTEYRLARTSSGEMVLQGRFFWQEAGFGGLNGYEWRTLETAAIE